MTPARCASERPHKTQRPAGTGRERRNGIAEQPKSYAYGVPQATAEAPRGVVDAEVPREEPEFGNDRRRFLVAMLMLGAVRPERMTERIVAELADEAPT